MYLVVNKNNYSSWKVNGKSYPVSKAKGLIVTVSFNINKDNVITEAHLKLTDRQDPKNIALRDGVTINMITHNAFEFSYDELFRVMQDVGPKVSQALRNEFEVALVDNEHPRFINMCIPVTTLIAYACILVKGGYNLGALGHFFYQREDWLNKDWDSHVVDEAVYGGCKLEKRDRNTKTSTLDTLAYELYMTDRRINMKYVKSKPEEGKEEKDGESVSE